MEMSKFDRLLEGLRDISDFEMEEYEFIKPFTLDNPCEVYAVECYLDMDHPNETLMINFPIWEEYILNLDQLVEEGYLDYRDVFRYKLEGVTSIVKQIEYVLEMCFTVLGLYRSYGDAYCIPKVYDNATITPDFNQSETILMSVTDSLPITYIFYRYLVGLLNVSIENPIVFKEEAIGGKYLTSHFSSYLIKAVQYYLEYHILTANTDRSFLYAQYLRTDELWYNVNDVIYQHFLNEDLKIPLSKLLEQLSKDVYVYNLNNMYCFGFNGDLNHMLFLGH